MQLEDCKLRKHSLQYAVGSAQVLLPPWHFPIPVLRHDPLDDHIHGRLQTPGANVITFWRSLAAMARLSCNITDMMQTCCRPSQRIMSDVHFDKIKKFHERLMCRSVMQSTGAQSTVQDQPSKLGICEVFSIADMIRPIVATSVLLTWPALISRLALPHAIMDMAVLLVHQLYSLTYVNAFVAAAAVQACKNKKTVGPFCVVCCQ